MGSRSTWRRPALAAARAAPRSFDPRELLDLVALGTIADLVPLIDENRILVAAGLRELSARKRPGLAALAARAELDNAHPRPRTTSAFRLTPRLNAAGRLGEAQLSPWTCCWPGPTRTPNGWRTSCEDQNTRTTAHPGAGLDGGARRPRTAQDDAPRSWWAPRAGTPAWSASSPRAGRAVRASRGCDRRSRTGGARLGAHLAGFNLYEALGRCATHLTKHGGHAGAAGMSVTRRSVRRLSARLRRPRPRRQLDGRRAGLRRGRRGRGLRELTLPRGRGAGAAGPVRRRQPRARVRLPGVTSRCRPGWSGKGHLQLTLDARRRRRRRDRLRYGDRRSGCKGARVDLIAQRRGRHLPGRTRRSPPRVSQYELPSRARHDIRAGDEALD